MLVQCDNVGFLLRITVKIVKYMHIIVPIILVIMVIFDMFKAMVGQADEKAKKEATTKAAKRLIYATIVFLIPTLISIIFTKLDTLSNTNTQGTSTTSTSWTTCWLAEYNK